MWMVSNMLVLLYKMQRLSVTFLIYVMEMF